MPTLTPSPPHDASLTQRGVVSLVAQQFAGGKSFVSASAGASDRALTAGTSVADASVHEQFRLLSLRTGINGTEKEYLRVSRPVSILESVATIDGQNITNTFQLRLQGAGAGLSGLEIATPGFGRLWLTQQQPGLSALLYAENKGLLLSQNANAYDSTTLMKFVVNGPTGVATSVPAFGFESGALGTNQKLARFMANGAEVFAINGASVHFNGYPNGYIYCSGSWLELGALPVRVPSYVDGRDSSLAFYAGAAGRFASNGTLKLMSDTLGAGASDVCAKIGTLTADASVSATAKLASFVTGFIGTEVEKAFMVKDGTFVQGGSVAFGEVVYSRSGVSQAHVGYLPGSSEVGIYSANLSVAIALNLGTGAARVSGSLTSGGEIENTATGGGVVLKSPDGTRWRVTVTNAGAINVAAA